MNDQSIDGDIQSPMAALSEQSLAVDLAKVEIDQAIATAHKFPRSRDRVLKKIQTYACYNEASAESCIYSLPRGGKPIIGPSVHFANIVSNAWGNCKSGGRIVYVDRKEKVVVAEGAFQDMESNVTLLQTVNRRIVGKNGAIYNDDMINVTGMAAVQIARRNAILNAVSRALWFPIYEQALLIVRGDVETFAERKDKALKAFAQFGVKPEQVFAVLGLKGEPDMTVEHIPTLRGMYGALRDGSTTVEELFDPRKMTGMSFERVANPLADDEPDEGQPIEQTSGAADHVDPQTGEVQETAAAAAPAALRRGRPPKNKTEPAKEMANAPAPGNEQKTKETVKDQPAAPETRTSPEMKIDQQLAETARPVEPALPRNTNEYVAYFSAWCAATASATAVDERWKAPAERALRTNCSIIEDDFERCRKIKDARIVELKKIQI